MSYIYNDEDNAPMNEDAWAEFNREQAQFERFIEKRDLELDRRLEMEEEARDIKRCQIWEFFLDSMEIPRGSACRECDWMKEGILEAYEDQADDDLVLPPDVYDLAHRMCAVCNAHSEEDRDEAIQAFFEEEDRKNGNS